MKNGRATISSSLNATAFVHWMSISQPDSVCQRERAVSPSQVPCSTESWSSSPIERLFLIRQNPKHFLQSNNHNVLGHSMPLSVHMATWASNWTLNWTELLLEAICYCNMKKGETGPKLPKRLVKEKTKEGALITSWSHKIQNASNKKAGNKKATRRLQATHEDCWDRTLNTRDTDKPTTSEGETHRSW